MNGASGGDHGNQYTGGKNPQRGNLASVKTKSDQLAELGKRCAEMETNKDFHGNRFSEIRSAENTKTKADCSCAITSYVRIVRPVFAKNSFCILTTFDSNLIRSIVDSPQCGKSKSDHLAELGFTRHDISRCLPVLLIFSL